MPDRNDKQYYSFEEASGDDVFGDILTGKKVNRPLKIGLLTCGYFEYWRMYPDRLKSLVENDLNRIADRLEKDYPDRIVRSGMVDTLDTADAAGKRFKAEGIDLLLIVEGTYIPDFITLHVIDLLGDIPLLFFSAQAESSIRSGADYEESLRNSGLIGTAQITGTLKKMGRRYHIVVGSADDERAYGKIREYVTAWQAVCDLKESNIGVIGHVFRGMYDLELNKTLLKEKFGVNIIYIQSSHLMDEWERADPEKAEEIADSLLSRFPSRGITRDDVVRAVRLGLAMQALADKFRLNALCFLDQHYVQKQTGTTARMGASLMMETSDLSVSCEGDIGGLIMMMLMRSVSGLPALMSEWGEFDAENNAVLLMGHGIGIPALASEESGVTLTGTPEMWGFSGNGLNYEYIVKPGRVTIGHIMETHGGYQMIASELESLRHDKFEYSELHALLRTPEPVTDYLERLLGYGVSHHCILGMGAFSSVLADIADILGMERFVI